MPPLHVDIGRGICILRPNFGVPMQHEKCFSNWETIVTQTENQNESQSSFNKHSVGPQEAELLRPLS